MVFITRFIHFMPFPVIESSNSLLLHTFYYEIYAFSTFSRNSILPFYHFSTHPITKKMYFLTFLVIELSIFIVSARTILRKKCISSLFP